MTIEQIKDYDQAIKEIITEVRSYIDRLLVEDAGYLADNIDRLVQFLTAYSAQLQRIAMLTRRCWDLAESGGLTVEDEERILNDIIEVMEGKRLKHFRTDFVPGAN